MGSEAYVILLFISLVNFIHYFMFTNYLLFLILCTYIIVLIKLISIYIENFINRQSICPGTIIAIYLSYSRRFHARCKIMQDQFPV